HPETQMRSPINPEQVEPRPRLPIPASNEIHLPYPQPATVERPVYSWFLWQTGRLAVLLSAVGLWVYLRKAGVFRREPLARSLKMNTNVAERCVHPKNNVEHNCRLHPTLGLQR